MDAGKICFSSFSNFMRLFNISMNDPSSPASVSFETNNLKVIKELEGL